MAETFFIRDRGTAQPQHGHAGRAAEFPAEAARVHGRDAYLRIKGASRVLIEDAGGTEFARTRVGKTRLSDYGNPNVEQWAPADVIADLERETGNPRVTRELAALAGFRLVPIDAPAPVVEVGARACVQATAALGALAAVMVEAGADGVLDAAELDAIIATATNAEDLIGALRTAAQRLRARGGR